MMLFANSAIAKKKKEFYEIKIYTIKNIAQETRMDFYFKNALYYTKRYIELNKKNPSLKQGIYTT